MSLRGVKRRSNPVKGLIRKIKTEIVYMIYGLPRKTGVFLAMTLKGSLRGAKRRSNPVKNIVVKLRYLIITKYQIIFTTKQII